MEQSTFAGGHPSACLTAFGHLPGVEYLFIQLNPSRLYLRLLVLFRVMWSVSLLPMV